MEARDLAESGNARATRTCVVWHAEGAAPPRALEASLGRKRVRTRAVASPYHALGALCAPDPRGGGGGGLLILVRPDELSQASRVVEVARRFAAATVIAVFDERSSPMLRPLARADLAGRESEAEEPEARPVPIPPASGGAPELRLHGGNGEEIAPEEPETEERAMLTDEELSMLLGDARVPGRSGSERG